eukprot:UN15918
MYSLLQKNNKSKIGRGSLAVAVLRDRIFRSRSAVAIVVVHFENNKFVFLTWNRDNFMFFKMKCFLRDVELRMVPTVV